MPKVLARWKRSWPKSKKSLVVSIFLIVVFSLASLTKKLIYKQNNTLTCLPRTFSPNNQILTSKKDTTQLRRIAFFFTTFDTLSIHFNSRIVPLVFSGISTKNFENLKPLKIIEFPNDCLSTNMAAETTSEKNVLALQTFLQSPELLFRSSRRLKLRSCCCSDFNQ